MVAAISVGGICLDLFGGLYLACDLPGGSQGPLRLLTRIVTCPVGLPFAAAFGITITAGQVSAYQRGMRHGMDYSASRRPRFTRRQFQGTVIRTAGYIATALACVQYLVTNFDTPVT